MQYKYGKADYLDVLANTNKLSEQGFEEWIFHPGMLFHSRKKWWSEEGERVRPHEGLDLYLYRDREGNTHQLDRHIQVPAIMKGEIVRLTDDFIGKTIYVRHDMHDKQGRYLCTMYGHVLPSDDNKPGRTVERHEIIASVVYCTRKNSPPPHLHISVAWVPESIEYHMLGWEALDRSGAAVYVDPLEFLQSKK